MVCCVYAESLSHVWLIANPWTIFCQAPLSWNFPGKNAEVGCHCTAAMVW